MKTIAASPKPSVGYDMRLPEPPKPLAPRPRWYQKKRVVVPAVALMAFILGIGTGGGEATPAASEVSELGKELAALRAEGRVREARIREQRIEITGLRAALAEAVQADDQDPTSAPVDLPVESSSEPSEPEASSKEEGSKYGIDDRLVLQATDDVEVRGLNDAERTLGEMLADRVGTQPWWPLVGEVYVEEDMFISDVRIGVDILYHPDVFDLSSAMCEAFVAALPETDKSLIVDIRPTYVYGGGEGIDGAEEPWKFSYSQTAASGDNFSSGPCSARSLNQTAADNTERYLAD